MIFLRPHPSVAAPALSTSTSSLGLRAAALASACVLAGALPRTLSAQTLQPELPQTPSPKVERIVHEDAGSRVQELKVGGQTKQIEVQTKADLPAYQINPADAAQGPANPDGQRTGNAGTAGRATWRLFNF
jgi:hypothetical protein